MCEKSSSIIEQDGYTIRTFLKPGDMGYITYLHGILYAQEQGWDHTFEAYVAVPLSEFAQSANPAQRIWIVQQVDTICGCIALAQLSADVAQLRWFLLAPSLRGKGVGKKLIGLLLDFARQQGYQSIVLWTVKGLDAACALYVSQGFELVEEKSSQLWRAQITEQKYQLML